MLPVVKVVSSGGVLVLSLKKNNNAMETTTRQSYLDWLRIIAIAGVLLFHSSMPYVAEWSWHIKNAETSNLMLEVAFFFHLVRMPLLFFISGTVSYYMMQRRSGWAFMGLENKLPGLAISA